PREGLGEYVLYFGSLAPWQGIDYMLEAHASSEWPAGLKLIVIGGGVKQAAVEQAQGDSLQWLGPLEPAEVAAYAAGAICTLCTKSNAGSMSEVTVPFKILESVAAGVPVVATDIPAQVAMLAAGFGLLASAEHPADLAKAVASIHADAGLRESLAVRAREAAPTLRWESAAPQLAAAIRALAISHDPVARG
ncbi:MAG: glycosyl transferase group 1 family protein, partial [Microbacteriaceae bacterium]|nr:glycosyl transferase group 1 family protein [Microbacteriaceae bacterium]